MWFDDIANQHTNCQVFLVGNKADLLTARIVQTEEGEQLAKELHACYREISAKTGYNIDSFFDKILSDLPSTLKTTIPSTCTAFSIVSINSITYRH